MSTEPPVAKFNLGFFRNLALDIGFTQHEAERITIESPVECYTDKTLCCRVRYSCESGNYEARGQTVVTQEELAQLKGDAISLAYRNAMNQLYAEMPKVRQMELVTKRLTGEPKQPEAQWTIGSTTASIFSNRLFTGVSSLF